MHFYFRIDVNIYCWSHDCGPFLHANCEAFIPDKVSWSAAAFILKGDDATEYWRKLQAVQLMNVCADDHMNSFLVGRARRLLS